MAEYKSGVPADALALARAQALVLALVKDSADAGRDHDLAVRRLLARTVDYFGVQAGFVSEIFNGIATVETVAGETGEIAPGAVVPIAGAPCEQSMQSDRPVVLTRPDDEAVLARLPVEIDVASEFRYREAPLPDQGLSLFVSQSGETADTLAGLRYARQNGQVILSVVNVPTCHFPKCPVA